MEKYSIYWINVSRDNVFAGLYKKGIVKCDVSHLVFVFATQSNFVFATQSKYAFIHELFLLEVFPFLCLCYFKQQRITFRRTLHILLDEICK